jgi:hypothetical protein
MYPMSIETLIAISSLILSIIATAISLQSARYARKQFELDREKFSDDLERLKPNIRIKKCYFEHLIETPDKLDKNETLKPLRIGIMKGKRSKEFLGAETRIHLGPFEGQTICYLGVRVSFVISISNEGELPVLLEDLMMGVTMRQNFHRADWFRSKYFASNHLEVCYRYPKHQCSINSRVQGERWFEFVRQCRAIEKRFIRKIEVLDYVTSENIELVSNKLQLLPASKHLWLVNIYMTPAASNLLNDPVCTPSKIVVSMGWEGNEVSDTVEITKTHYSRLSQPFHAETSIVDLSWQ